MNVIAQAEQVIKAADQAIASSAQSGLIGVILVLLLLFLGTCVIVAFRFVAPLLRDFTESAVECHVTIKSQMVVCNTKLDGHTKSLEEIKTIVSRCPQPSQYRPVV